MAYLDIIPLADAKVYLRIDDTLTDDDAQITRMIKGALSFVERSTNVMLFAREKTYRFINGVVSVYDSPINSITTPTDDLTSETKTLYTNYCYSVGDNSLLTLNVGYADLTDIPQELIEVAYEVIELMYYEKQTNKSHLDSLSSLSTMILNNYKRFIL